jgi:phosphate acetyltransferase
MSESASKAADLHIFNQFIARSQKFAPLPVAVAWPLSDVALGGAIEAAEKGIIKPILVGAKDKIEALAAKLGLDLSKSTIVDAPSEVAAAQQAVALCRSDEAKALMKGSLHTDDLMRAVVNKETGLRTASRISHAFIFDVPTYDRTFLVTDAAVNIVPDLKTKIHILNNAIGLAHALGIAEPKVALLSAVEVLNPKIPSTVDYVEIVKMAKNGEFPGSIIDGPLSFDLAISANSAAIKKVNSPVSGQPDILLTPDLESGNILIKALVYLAKAQVAGIVLGAKVPIILTSRADSAESRLTSCAVASIYANAK